MGIALVVAICLNAKVADTAKLEQQIQQRSEIGVEPNKGFSIGNLLISFAREDYEQSPCDLILLVCGVEIEEEPWVDASAVAAWNFDAEAIEGGGSYIEIVQ